MRLTFAAAAAAITIAVTASSMAFAQPASRPVTVELEPAAPVAADPGAEVVCRKSKETGSLIKAKKVCHTKSQWAYIDEQHQRFGRQMVQDGTTRPSGQ